MSDTVSAKIIRKNVKEGAGWGGSDKVSFLVWYKGKEDWLSVFADPKKMSAEVIQLLRDLGEGDRAEFTIEENKGKDGRTYKNIVGIQRETQMKEDERDVPAVRPDGHDKPKQSGDNRDKMMLKSYSKDATNMLFPVVWSAPNNEDTDPVETWTKIFDRIYAHISAGE